MILELIQTGGYKIIVSTHSPVFLEFAWAFNLLKESRRNQYAALYEMFGIPESSPVSNMLNGLFRKQIQTYYFKRSDKNGKVMSYDISSLDVNNADSVVSEWGGLSAFSTKVSDVVSRYMADYED